MFIKKMITALLTALIVNTALMSQKPQIFVQSGHTDNISGIVFSPDGKYLASAGDDKKIILWNLQNGRELYSLNDISENGIGLSFCNGGKQLASFSYAKEIIIWNVEKAQKEKIYPVSDEVLIYAMAVSPDGSILACAALRTPDENFILLINPITDEQKIIHTNHEETIHSIQFSPDGKCLLTASGAYEYPSENDPNETIVFSKDNSIRIYRISDGKEILRFPGHKKMVHSAIFSPDGKKVISVGADSALIIWNIRTGKPEAYQKGNFHSVDISTDGKYLSAVGDYVRIWEFSTGTLIAEETEPCYCARPFIRFSPSGKFLAVARDHTIEIINPKLESRFTFGGKVIQPLKAFVLSERKLRLSFIGSSLVYDYDLTTGKLEKTEELSNYNSDFYYDKNYRTLIYYANENLRYSFDENIRYSLSLSPHSRYAIEVNNEYKIFSFPGCRYVAEIEQPIKRFSQDKIAFSPNGKWFAAPMDNDESIIGLWETATGRRIRQMDGQIYTMTLLFTRDSRYLIAGGTGGLIHVWETESGHLIHTLQEHTDPVFSLAVSEDGRRLLSGSWDQKIKLWDLINGRCLQTLTGHGNWITSLTFVNGNDIAVSGSRDGTFRLWNLNQGKELLSFFHFKDGEWIVMSPEGYYQSSVYGDQYMNIRVGTEVYGVDQYRNIFYKPAFVENILRNFQYTQVHEEKNKVNVVQYEPPFIVIKSPDDGAQLNLQNHEISFYVEDRNQPLKEISVYVNGRNAATAATRGMKSIRTTEEIPDNGKSVNMKIPVQLDPGENLVEIIASNGFTENRKSIRVKVNETTADTKTILPNLWILAIGINRYQDKNFPTLNYAAQDANGIAKIFSEQKGKLFREVHVLQISDESDINPTYENIIDNLNFLKKSGTNDVAILFIAGHGLNDESGEFYFLPSDAAMLNDGSIKRSRAISWREIRSILDFPGKKIVLVDACHSEGVSGKKTRSADPNRFVKELQDANAVIFTSSRATELSQESAEWGHGVFTYALIQGLKGKANFIQDGKISMKELDTYVSETVPQLTKGAQHPITYTPDGYVNFPVAIIE